jgi:syntaxin 6
LLGLLCPRAQLNELDNAVDRASENPTRFNLTPEELGSRRRWIGNTRRQVEGMKETLKTATAIKAAVFNAESKAVARNEKFLGDESQRQQLVMK